MKIVISCDLCGEKSLHLYKENEFTTRQCINCGYSTNDKLRGKKEDNDVWNSFSDFIKKYTKESGEKIWFPSLLTLPFGSLYPVEKENKLKWAFSKLLDIPAEEQKNYPVEGVEDKFHTKMLDMDHPTYFDSYLEGLATIRQEMDINSNG